MHLSVIHDGTLLVVQQVRSPRPICLSVEEGSRLSLLKTASGKILLAMCAADDRETLLADSLEYRSLPSPAQKAARGHRSLPGGWARACAQRTRARRSRCRGIRRRGRWPIRRCARRKRRWRRHREGGPAANARRDRRSRSVDQFFVRSCLAACGNKDRVSTTPCAAFKAIVPHSCNRRRLRHFNL